MERALSERGTFAGFSDTPDTDPYDPLCFFDCSIDHAVEWRNGKLIDLGTIPGSPGASSGVTFIAADGLISGASENGHIDPLTGAPAVHGVIWINGKIVDLGTLRGGTVSWANNVNDFGQVVGFANNAVTDENSLEGLVTETRAFLWQGGVVGQATTKNDAEDHPYLWQHGEMTDLGTLGGTYGFASWLNDRGEVVGAVTNAGDQEFLPFQWHNGKLKGLPNLPGNRCGVADAINLQGQVVGGSGVNEAAFFPDCTDSEEHAVLWDDGKVVDLNEFVPEDSELTLNEASYINEFGEITGLATLPDGSAHTFLLIPCREGEHCGRVKAKTASDATARVRASTLQRSHVLRGRAFCKRGCNRQ
jgi:probable HAF family extracellular repeat protein